MIKPNKQYAKIINNNNKFPSLIYSQSANKGSSKNSN